MNAKSKYMYHVLIALTITLVASGTLFYHIVEKWSFLDAYYFCIVTLATVGYGDLVPHTDIGKLFTTFYILIGIGILTSFINAFVKRRGIKMESRATKHVNKHKQ